MKNQGGELPPAMDRAKAAGLPIDKLTNKMIRDIMKYKLCTRSSKFADARPPGRASVPSLRRSETLMPPRATARFPARPPARPFRSLS